jgi:hypothetical protein
MNNAVETNSNSVEITDDIRAAQKLMKQDRRQGLAALNDLFRAGQPPEPPLNGPYNGELVAVDIAPGVTQFVEWLTSFWMPWKGKYLIREDAKGDNIFDQKSRLLMRILFPFYRGIIENDKETFRAFVFKTSIDAGRVDPDRKVFRIDYNSPDNPALTIRRILDEVVQVKDGVYLGKIHFKWWWGAWQMIGYFSLRMKK